MSGFADPILSAHAVFCDDVRREVGGKLSLMGIYKGVCQFSEPAPVVLPSLCVVVFAELDPALPDDVPLLVSLSGPDSDTRTEMNARVGSIPPKETDGPLHMTSVATTHRLRVSSPGRMTASLTVGCRTLPVGHLQFTFGEEA